MTMHWRDVASSTIRSVGYDSRAKEMGVIFHSNPTTPYHYRNTELHEYDALMRADSTGSHFHKHFRSQPEKHPFRKVIPNA